MTPTNRPIAIATLSLAALFAPGCVSKESGARELNYHPRNVLIRWTQAAQIDPQEQDRVDALNAVSGVSLREYALVDGLELIEINPDIITIEEAVAVLATQSGVLYAEHDYIVRSLDTPDDEHFRLQWNLANVGQTVGGHPGSAGSDIRAETGWDEFTGAADFVIAVIDTGVQTRHPDLQRNVWINTGEMPGMGDNDGNGYVDDFLGWDFFSNDADPDDPEGHGSHVAGIIGAVGNNSLGVAGINWNCQIMALRFMGSGRGTTSNAIAALQYAVEKHVRVSCNSWGDDDHSGALKDAISAAGDEGHLFVTAAGNDSADIEIAPVYPASFKLPNMITVAATDARDELGAKSNWGAEVVHLGAPGVYVLSTSNDSEYSVRSGTSMAAAHVAGVAAMVMAAHPELSLDQVRDRLFATVRLVPSLLGKAMHPGVVSLADALKR